MSRTLCTRLVTSWRKFDPVLARRFRPVEFPPDYLSFPASTKQNLLGQRFCSTGEIVANADKEIPRKIKNTGLQNKILHSTVYNTTVENGRKEVPTIVVSIHWNDGHHDDFPGVWLRDNCQCSQCYNKHAGNRTLLMEDLDVNVKPEKVYSTHTELDIEWSDGHSSQYNSNWLRDRAFREEGIQTRRIMAKGPKKILWGSEHKDEIKYHKFGSIISQPQAMYDWINDLSIFGFSIIYDMPNNFDCLPDLIQQIGIEKATHYGKNFKVMSKQDENVSNAAYTTLPLGLHLDMPIYQHKPGVQFLQCVEQEQHGGENQFSDGFMVEKVMRERYHNEWKTLAETGVVFIDENVDEFGDFNKVHITPTFDMGKDGNIKSVNYNNQMRSQFLNVLFCKVQPLYNALKLFNNIAYGDEYLINLKLQPGQCAVFDNHRVLHGRSGFEMHPDSGTRIYHGGYIDWDELISKLNVLRIKLGMS